MPVATLAPVGNVLTTRFAETAPAFTGFGMVVHASQPTVTATSAGTNVVMENFQTMTGTTFSQLVDSLTYSIQGQVSEEAGSKSAIRRTFIKLTEEWRRTARRSGRASQITDNAAYRAIIELGTPVIPLIIKDLAQEPRHWFHALYALTKADPVPAKHAGRVDLMAKDWIGWWKTEQKKRSVPPSNPVSRK